MPFTDQSEKIKNMLAWLWPLLAVLLLFLKYSLTLGVYWLGVFAAIYCVTYPYFFYRRGWSMLRSFMYGIVLGLLSTFVFIFVLLSQFD